MRGAEQETQALSHLQRQGLKPVARNFRARGGELDLVMEDGDTLAVIEVRARARRDFGSAAESVSATKRTRIIHAARLFLLRHPRYASWPLRFDIVAFDGTAQPQWLRAAFDASD